MFGPQQSCKGNEQYGKQRAEEDGEHDHFNAVANIRRIEAFLKHQ